MVIDTMDRVAGLSALDYMLTKGIDDASFVKNINRFGLSVEDVQKLRSSGFAKLNAAGFIDEVDFSKINEDMHLKLERAMRRAVDDVVLKADELDLPEWSKSMFSPAIAKAIFQFMRFPIVAHTKIGVKMANNPTMVGIASSAAVGIGLLSLISQAKDVGKEKPRFDLSTEDGKANFAKMVIEYTPALGSTALLQMQFDAIGRITASAQDKEYRDNQEGIGAGVTVQRLNKLSDSMRNVFDGTANGRDVSEMARWTSTNFYLTSPFVNMMHDNLKEMEFDNE
jgi:hypothetical protein